MILFFSCMEGCVHVHVNNIRHSPWEISSKNTIYSCCKRFHLYMSWSAMVLLKLYKQFKVSRES